jgi:Flp pilus assembly pilin Flp
VLTLYVHLQSLLLVGALALAPAPAGARLGGRRLRGERGQASAEYALVLLGAAAVALLVVAWATKTDMMGKLLDKVLKAISGKAQ